THWAPPIAELCKCLPLSSLYNVASPEQKESENEQIVPITPFLSSQLQSLLDSLFPRSTPLSMLLLHVSQVEQAPVAPLSVFSHKKQRYHVSPCLVEQILVNIRRVLRFDDQLLVH